MNFLSEETSDRKLDHINICLEEEIEGRYKTPGFEDIDFLHNAVPDTDLDGVDLGTSLFGKELKAPITICPMTGGHERGKEINKTLAGAAQELGLAMGVGSQRAAIESPDLAETYQVREVAPDILLFGNLGVAQIRQEYGVEEAEEAIEIIDADVLGLHLNPLQESIQPEGDTDFRGVLAGISALTSKLEESVYVKETGGGISGNIAVELVEAGAEAIDVSGAGGTSWAAVETLREESRSDLGGVFWDWGIPTSVSTAEVAGSVGVPVISSGGIRTGLDAAKAIALGADLVGVGLPLFRSSTRGKEKVLNWLEEFIRELKTAMFLTGCSSLEELRDVPLVISGLTREWFSSRGLDIKQFQEGR